MHELLEFVKEFDIHNLFSIGIIFWIITRGWRNEVREEIKSIREDITKQGQRTDRLYEMFIDLVKNNNKG